MELSEGTRVAYTAAFVRSVGGHEVAERRGTVLSVSGDFARVRWDDAREPQSVHTSNLAIPGPNSRFAG